jgi:glycerate 2-kinase
VDNRSPDSLTKLRASAVGIFHAGVAAADPYAAIQRCLMVKDDLLHVRQVDGWRTGKWPKVHLIAFGKAACAMVSAAVESIGAHFPLGNALAVTNYENAQSLPGIRVIGAGHPLPDENGLRAAHECAEIAKNAEAGELVLVLVSGGGSALLPYPVEGVTLADKIRTTELLLASGATINEINCVRKHLSRLKGGGLAKLIAPADCHTLILSDVLGDDVSAIASGPTVPDATTFAEAARLLHTKGVWHAIPDSVRACLEQGLQGQQPETPKAGDGCFEHSAYSLIGSNRISLEAVVKAAQESGYQTLVYNDRLCGEARDQAKALADTAGTITPPQKKQIAIVAGGETTVTLKGKGKGGRNQEMALAFALAAKGRGLLGNWVFLSGGTDGRDGPTDAAGGVVDSGTIARIESAGLEPQSLLDNNDSYPALRASQDLLVTGATGTNVADLQVLLIKN